ncbi:MAG: glutamine synthetase beta-grasp domain-containing protein [Planctomycetes bacterium]|nr:glutamine synthetase beta-grasp domain-containing protein [Planctomycetota bacterium]
MAKDVKWVLSQLKDVRFVQVRFTDILGSIKGFTIPADALPVAFEEGKGFDGSSIEGFTRIDESDMCAWPDPSTFVLAGPGLARMFADIKNPDGTPFEGDRRGRAQHAPAAGARRARVREPARLQTHRMGRLPHEGDGVRDRTVLAHLVRRRGLP